MCVIIFSVYVCVYVMTFITYPANVCVLLFLVCVLYISGCVCVCAGCSTDYKESGQSQEALSGVVRPLDDLQEMFMKCEVTFDAQRWTHTPHEVTDQLTIESLSDVP